MSGASTCHMAHLLARIGHCRMHNAMQRLGALLASRWQLQAGEQPDWAHVPGRVWRRHSMLLTTLHEMRAGGRHG